MNTKKYLTIIAGVALWMIVMTLLIFSTIKCENAKLPTCWQCEVKTKFIERGLEVTGRFELCDQTQAEMEGFMRINTYSDSTMIQTCNCK
jgi:hypothetical protein